MPSESWKDWSANQTEISQRLRALADQWDRGLTEVDPMELHRVFGGLVDVKVEMYAAIDDMPKTPADAAAARVDLSEDK